MFRSRALAFLAATALSAVTLSAAALPLMAHPGHSSVSHLDEEGKPFGTAWTAVERFDSLAAASMDDVRFTTGPRWQVRASGDPRALAQLRYLVRKEGLIVGRVSGQRERYGKVRIEVTAPALHSATAAGSGSLAVDRLGGDRASVTVAGSGQATVGTVASERLNATVAGSGGLTLAGRSDASTITVAGSGALTGGGFVTRQANVTVAGSGSARFRASGPVRASLVGSGNVAVSGTTDCSQTRMGSGRLVCTR